MAQQTIVLLTDDLDGESEAAETVSFALDGKEYEIDLSDEHASQLRERFLEWSQHARKVGSSRSARRQPAAASSAAVSGEDPNVIREWARSAGYEVSARGRIAQVIRAAYHQALG